MTAGNRTEKLLIASSHGEGEKATQPVRADDRRPAALRTFGNQPLSLSHTFENCYLAKLVKKLTFLDGQTISIRTPFNEDSNYQGEALSPHPDFVFSYAYTFSIHLNASTSLTFPKYLWVVDRFACRRIILLTISMGVPQRDACVAACLLRSCGLR